jgi:coenzyme F420-reducing hydrogenase delta subunit
LFLQIAQVKLGKAYMRNGTQQDGHNPEIVVLYCQHGICDQARGSAWSQEIDGLSVRAVMMPCSSKIEVPYIIKIFESGVDAVEIVACPEKSCKLLTGSLRAEKRVDYIRGLLETIGYAPERVGISRKLSQKPDQLIEIARTRADAVRSLGANPMKTGEQQ